MKTIGIIGCGKIAQVRHIPELHMNPDAAIGGYYNPTRSRAEEMSATYGGRVYDSIESMLADNRIDAVVVCLANQAHAAVSIKAMRSGKAVLCEKPMAVTAEECEAMAQVSKETGMPLMIAQNQRLAKAHIEAKRLLGSGRIGKLLSFRTTFGHSGPETWSINPGKGTWFFDKKAASMGAMADLGIHKTDLIQYITGQNIVSVKAKIATLDKTDENGGMIGVDDNAICIFTLEGGAIGTMTASWTYYGQEDNSTILYGTNGIMRIYDEPACSIRIIDKDGTEEMLDLDIIQTNDNQTSSGMTDEFIRILETGEKNGFFLSAETVLPAMRAIFAAFRSDETGEEVLIPENIRTSNP